MTTEAIKDDEYGNKGYRVSTNKWQLNDARSQ